MVKIPQLLRGGGGDLDSQCFVIPGITLPVRLKGGRRDLENQEGFRNRGERAIPGSVFSLPCHTPSLSMGFYNLGGPAISEEICGQRSFVEVIENNMWLRRRWLFLLTDSFGNP